MSDIKPGYTRVSSIASAYAGYHKIQQNVLDRAAARGDRVHKIIFDITNDIAVPGDRYEFMGDNLKGYLESWSQYYSPFFGCEVILQEQRIDDEKIMLTGEPDLIIMQHGKKILLDWKCSYSVGKHWNLQASGYYYLANSLGISLDEIYFVKLDKAGKPPVVTKIEPNVSQFFWAYELYKEYLNECKCNLEDE